VRTTERTMRSIDEPFGSLELVSSDPLVSGFSDDAVAVAQLAHVEQVPGMGHLPGAHRLAGTVVRRSMCKNLMAGTPWLKLGVGFLISKTGGKA
jgi:hypothetical protein